MIVVLDLEGVVLDLTAETSVTLLGARLLTEYVGAGFSYALKTSQPEEDARQVLKAAGLPQVPVLLSVESSAEWTELGECCKPGVYVSVSSLSRPVSPSRWGRVTFHSEWPYHVLVQKIWDAAPSEVETKT